MSETVHFSRPPTKECRGVIMAAVRTLVGRRKADISFWMFRVGRDSALDRQWYPKGFSSPSSNPFGDHWENIPAYELMVFISFVEDNILQALLVAQWTIPLRVFNRTEEYVSVDSERCQHRRGDVRGTHWAALSERRTQTTHKAVLISIAQWA
ncbi:hypothetical protein CEXT_600711 [Caerostris extrusa]|uniref:Uncharacterized protein n=1 Tax=Caerostris extrusa TaxID=172846 RepID=A0AAV4NFH1_CAEEX|nr:hypothetical protein CEXT_600711 [Caerostris extrusa]